MNSYKKAIKKIHFDMHTPHTVENVGSEFDADIFAQQVADAGCDAVVYFSRGAYGWAYYPSKVNLPHPNMKIDLFGEGVNALRKKGIKVVAYTVLAKTNFYQGKANPQWVSRDAQGNLQIHYENNQTLGYFTCPTGSFFKEVLHEHYKELVQWYDVDAIWVDGVYQIFNKPCYCPRCKKLFKEYSGYDIPIDDEDENWYIFRLWQKEIVWNEINKAAKFIKNINANVPYGVNWIGGTYWSEPPASELGFLTGDPQLNNGAFEMAYNMATWSWRDIASDLYTQRMYTWQDLNTRSIHNIILENAIVLASSGSLMVGDVLDPIKLDFPKEKSLIIKNAFTATSKLENAVANMKSYADIAILQSSENIRDKGSIWRIDKTTMLAAYSIACEEGFTTHILYNKDIATYANNYKLIVLPELEYITTEAAQALQDYVYNGGNLLIVGKLPGKLCSNQNNDKAEYSWIENLAGVSKDGVIDSDINFIKVTDTVLEEIWPKEVAKTPICIKGKVESVKTTSAQMICPITLSGQKWQVGAVGPGHTSDKSAISVNIYGKGKVWYASMPLLTDGYNNGHFAATTLLQQLMTMAVGDYNVKRINSSMVQAFWQQNNKKTTVTLVAHQAGIIKKLPYYIKDPATLCDVSIRVLCDKEVSGVNAILAGKEIDYILNEGYLEITVPQFKIWEAIDICWK